MNHASRLIGIAAAGLVLSTGALAAEPADTNLGPAVVGASQSSIFGETDEEIRRNRMIAAGIVGAVVLGVVLLDDDDDPEQPPPGPEPMPHHSAHHG